MDLDGLSIQRPHLDRIDRRRGRTSACQFPIIPRQSPPSTTRLPFFPPPTVRKPCAGERGEPATTSCETLNSTSPYTSGCDSRSKSRHSLIRREIFQHQLCDPPQLCVSIFPILSINFVPVVGTKSPKFTQFCPLPHAENPTILEAITNSKGQNHRIKSQNMGPL